MRWKSILDCLPVGIAVMNPDNSLEFVNTEMQGYLSAQDASSNVVDGTPRNFSFSFVCPSATAHGNSGDSPSRLLSRFNPASYFSPAHATGGQRSSSLVSDHAGTFIQHILKRESENKFKPSGLFPGLVRSASGTMRKQSSVSAMMKALGAESASTVTSSCLRLGAQRMGKRGLRASNTCSLSGESDPDPLESIVDASGFSLRDALQIQDGSDRSYNMVHVKSEKVYEVKTKRSVCGLGCTVAVVKDQTMYQQLVKEQLLEKYLRMLMASISHDIRNPLNAVECYIDIMMETEDIADIKRTLGDLRSMSEHIDYIVAGACYLTITEGSAVVIQPEEFALSTAVRDILNIMRPSVVEKQVELQFDPAISVPEKFSSDEKKYRLLLFHLLTNAVKYTEQGRITVALAYDSASGMLTTRVEDTGCGIPTERLATVFELYSNVDTANSYNPQGMGLGLVLCKRLAKFLGGDIAVASSGEGTIFTFTVRNHVTKPAGRVPDLSAEEDWRDFVDVPLELDTRLVRAIAPKTMSHLNLSMPGETKKKKSRRCRCTAALVVDDEYTNRLVLRTYMKALGVDTVDEAGDGAAAVDKVLKKAASSCCRRYCAIFMDINMPTMDGTTATKRLMEIFNSNEELRTPVIAVTAANLNSREDAKALLSVGFTHIRILRPTLTRG